MATKTEIYELRKKEENDFYNIEDFNNNMDTLEKALTEFDDSGTAEGVTSFPEMLTKLVTGNKLAITLKNLKAGLQFVLHAGSIVNNCVTDNANLPVSAAMAKSLQDQINQANSNLISSYEKLNDIVLMKCGNIVIIDIAILKATLPGGWTKLFDIPSGYLPLPDIKNVDMYYIASMYVKGSDISKRIRVTNNVVYGYSDTSISGELYGMIVYVCG